jgi:hypothetical protein
MSSRSREIEDVSRRATGPKTAEGKAVSSKNARRHGLNAPPDENLVNTWFNFILDNGEDAHEELNADDPKREAALRLAIAEARYHRALHKVDIHEMEPHSAQQRGMKLRDEIWTVFDRMPKKMTDGPADPYDLAYVNFAVKQLEQLFTQISHERRLYKRYLGEARAQRRKALRAWCAFNRDENLNSRNELKLQFLGE